jgi:DNA invertase Pin-like site-specific DNA recombinase
LTVFRAPVTFTSTFIEANETEGKTMAMGKFVSYLRVSTQQQGKSGLGLEAQREAVAVYLNGGRWKLVEEVVEVESGKRSDRPELSRALSLCRIHGARLLVAKLDRLARNVAFISALMESGVDFEAVDLPQANKLTVHIMAAMAEYEAGAISTRTKAALAAAKARGTKLGGYRWDIQTVASKGNAESAKVRTAKASKHARDLRPLIQAIQAEGATSLRQIASALNERGIATARGGEWSAVQVQRLMDRV